MKNVFALFALILLCSFAPEQKTDVVKVVAVSDGDTIKVILDGVETRVRLASIDAPEKSQAYGQKAKEFTSLKCFGQTVTLRITDTDKYGRKVAFVTLPDGSSLNRELVRAGLAWHYKRYSTDASLDALQAEAKSAGRGLWADVNPVAPWDYRKSGSGN
ncbi:MAG: thermonuclease family protein [Cytophagales bacterium]|nr:thermonuclease family protein [Cytophagales bacterium]MCA6382377.1 thermonuclease family protein [Cytophagales bacterium]